MKIVLTGGGTAGHVTPNLAIAEKLHGHTLFYIGSDGMEKQLTEPYVKRRDIARYLEIPAHKLQRRLTLSNLLLPFWLCQSVHRAKQHLKSIAPDAIFSKGGYVGLPVTVAGKLLHIPTVIHESDMSPGLANRIASHFADRYLAAFDCNKHAEQVGVIVREEILHGDRAKGLATMGFDGAKPILLVTGGSLGAKALNDAVTALGQQLAKKYDIFVLSGKNKQLSCNFVHQAEFAANINDLFAACDVCLTRGGANALAELTLATVPFVAVPLCKSSRGEQKQNAQWFCDKGCGILLTEQQLETGLPSAIDAAYNNRTAIQAKQRFQKSLYGTDRVAEIILQTALEHQKKPHCKQRNEAKS